MLVVAARALFMLLLLLLLLISSDESEDGDDDETDGACVSWMVDAAAKVALPKDADLDDDVDDAATLPPLIVE